MTEEDKRKESWKNREPEKRSLIAQKGGQARASKLTAEQHTAHARMMLAKRYEAKKKSL